jgi:hypothetical protein
LFSRQVQHSPAAAVVATEVAEEAASTEVEAVVSTVAEAAGFMAAEAAGFMAAEDIVAASPVARGLSAVEVTTRAAGFAVDRQRVLMGWAAVRTAGSAHHAA